MSTFFFGPCLYHNSVSCSFFVSQKVMVAALAEPASALLDAATCRTWPHLRLLLDSECGGAWEDLKAALAGEGEGEEAVGGEVEVGLWAAGRGAVERRAKEEAMKALMLMKERWGGVVWGWDRKRKGIAVRVSCCPCSRMNGAGAEVWVLDQVWHGAES